MSQEVTQEMSHELFDDVLRCPNLPTLPVVAARVLELTSDPEVSMPEIAKVVQQDQALSAKVLKTVNSSYYGLSKRVGSIERAMGYLGLNTVKSLVLGFSLVEMSGDAHDNGFDLERHWRQTMLGAVGAKIIAEHARLDDSDEVFSAGLFQDIGVLAMFTAMKGRYMGIVGHVNHARLSAAEQESFGFTHAKIGAAMARKWNLPAPICEAIEHHHAASAPDVPDPMMVCAVIAGTRVAELQCAKAPRSAMSILSRMLAEFFPRVRFDAEDLVDRVGAEAKQLAELFDTEIGEVEDVRALMGRAQEAGLEHQISMQRQSEQLERESVTDALTGVPNRKRFDADLEHAYTRFKEEGTVLSVLFFDADRFKLVNDTHGHAAGDAVLVELARRAERSLSGDGTLYRYGGEEFVALLPGVRPIGAAMIAERLRASIEDPAFDLRALEEGPDELAVTVSVGVSSTESGPRDRIVSADTLVKEADESVYRAKEAGRNRVVVWGDTPDETPSTGQDAPPRGLTRRESEKPVMVLIEDDHLAATLIKTLLKRRNDPEIHWFTRGEDAVDYFGACVERGEYPCDLVVSDNELPGIGGLEVFGVFERLGLKDRVPFYMLTGCEGGAECERIKEMGVSACVTKAEFTRDLAKWLGVIGSSKRAVA